MIQQDRSVKVVCSLGIPLSRSDFGRLFTHTCFCHQAV